MMYHEILHFFIWSTLINFALVIIWLGVFVFAHDWLYRMHSRWFKFPVETFDTINYVGICIYEIGILLFNLVPLIALHFV